MFAIIETGGKQYKIAEGDSLKVEKLPRPAKSNTITFDKVLLIDDGKTTTVGNPYIKGAKVKATYVAFKKGSKITIIRYKAKSNRDRKIGHRQKYSTVEITSLV